MAVSVNAFNDGIKKFNPIVVNLIERKIDGIINDPASKDRCYNVSYSGTPNKRTESRYWSFEFNHQVTVEESEELVKRYLRAGWAEMFVCTTSGTKGVRTLVTLYEIHGRKVQSTLK